MFGSYALSFKLFLKAFEGDFKGGTFIKKFPLFYSIPLSVAEECV